MEAAIQKLEEQGYPVDLLKKGSGPEVPPTYWQSGWGQMPKATSKSESPKQPAGVDEELPDHTGEGE